MNGYATGTSELCAVEFEASNGVLAESVSWRNERGQHVPVPVTSYKKQ
jgi:hypothetical protein